MQPFLKAAKVGGITLVVLSIGVDMHWKPEGMSTREALVRSSLLNGLVYIGGYYGAKGGAAIGSMVPGGTIPGAIAGGLVLGNATSWLVNDVWGLKKGWK